MGGDFKKECLSPYPDPLRGSGSTAPKNSCQIYPCFGIKTDLAYSDGRDVLKESPEAESLGKIRAEERPPPMLG